MGWWNTEAGTLYRELRDQCRVAFNLDDVQPTWEAECFGDPVGDCCRCEWRSDDDCIIIHTPQSIGTSRYAGGIFPQRRWDLHTWLRGEIPWNRTTGFVYVTRAVPKDAPHLAWIDFERIADCFRIPLPEGAARAKQAELAGMISNDDWYVAEKRARAGFDYVPSCRNNPRALRLVTAKAGSAVITVGESSSVVGMAALQRAPVHAMYRGALPDQRLEFFEYEFKLAGRYSYEFAVPR